ncbi:MAG: XdhC family protein [Acidobacteria bacterium]|nr:XdhC family protein [Acidobacteriota bacterium]
MVEQRRIVEQWRRHSARVLVTIVHVEGSSYRRPGARLLVGQGGEYAGTISGGCLEAEIMRQAAWKVASGAVVERYSTLFDDTADVPYGLGCGGVVDLLLEPADTPECSALLHAMERALAGERSIVVTWLPGEAKTLRRAILDTDGKLLFASEGLNEKKLACAHGLEPGHEYKGRFVEELRAPQHLFVFGAGDDAKPLVDMATMMGWNAIVADGRPHLAKAERFPHATHVLAIAESDIEALGIRSEDVVVLMTHSYEQDRALLPVLLQISPRYLGLLGAKHRSSLLVSEAATLAGLSIEECCKRIWAPVGLDLGGDGPEAIALSIMAEVQAVCMGKAGATHRLSADDVASHLSSADASRYLQAHCAADAIRS